MEGGCIFVTDYQYGSEFFYFIFHPISPRGKCPHCYTQVRRNIHFLLREVWTIVTAFSDDGAQRDGGVPPGQRAVALPGLSDAPTFQLFPDNIVGYDTGIIHYLDDARGKPEGPIDVIDCEDVGDAAMIDSHVHVTASSADLRKPAFMTPSLLYARSVPILEGMLMRGLHDSSRLWRS